MKKEYEIKKQSLFDTTSTYLLVGDNPDLLLDKNYGNNDITTIGPPYI